MNEYFPKVNELFFFFFFFFFFFLFFFFFPNITVLADWA